MAEYHVITGKCTKAQLCLDVCQADAIHPTASEPEMAEVPQLYIDRTGASTAALAPRSARARPSTR